METIIDIQSFLMGDIGLSIVESSIYLSLLTNGPLTILEIARVTSINRATVHLNVENLKQKSLVSETKDGKSGKRKIVAEDPLRLEEIIDERKSKIERSKRRLPQIIRYINSLIPPTRRNTFSDVKYYEGRNSVRRVYDEVLKAKEIRCYVNTFIENIYPENPEKFIIAHNMREDMYLWEILDKIPSYENYTSKMVSSRYKYKIFKEKIFTPDYLIFDGRVAIIDFEPEIKAVLIQNDNFYSTSVMLFNFVWKHIK